MQELGRFADWLPQSDVAGVVIRSGKSSAFCAGADLAELETAYDMVMAAPTAERDGVADEAHIHHRAIDLHGPRALDHRGNVAVGLGHASGHAALEALPNLLLRQLAADEHHAAQPL